MVSLIFEFRMRSGVAVLHSLLVIMINYILLVSRQGLFCSTNRSHSKLYYFSGKVRLAKWFTTLPPKTKAKIVKDVTQLVLARRTRMCNVLEYKGEYTDVDMAKRNCLIFKDTKVVYRRYASLFFVCGIGPQDNELVTLEIIHRYVEVLDRYFGNVSSRHNRIQPAN